MSDILSIRLTPALRRELKRLSKRLKRPSSEIAREALRRYMAIEEFRSLRERTLPRAAEQGIITDEDVFRLIS